MVKARTRHRHQLEHASNKMVIMGTKLLIKQIEQQIATAEAALNQLIDNDPQLSNLNDILLSIPGIGQEVARTLIVELPDLGSGDPAKLCSLAGVVPFNCDSGIFRGKRRIYGGRAALRTVLYMAALSAVKCVKADNVFRQLYLRITATKPHKVGIVAVMHKMIIIAHAMVKNNEKWQNKMFKK